MEEQGACDGHLRARRCGLRRRPVDESPATRSVSRAPSRQHMSIPYGQTRTRVAARHALIAPAGHVKSNVPGIAGAATIILINEAMGAKFAQLLVTFES